MTDVRPMEERDRERLVELHALAFQVPEYRLVRQRTLALDQAWVIADDRGSVMGGLRAESLGQYFGGRSVPSAVVSAVKIAPEARGGGLARRLMTGALLGLRSRGLAISVLYPSTAGVYRAAGYEFAGSSVRYRIAPGALPRARGLAVQPWGQVEVPAIEACYRRYAASRSGLIDRSPAWWAERILDPFLDRPTQRYLVADGGEVVGYLVTGQSAAPGLPYGSEVAAIDFVWTTPAAARSLLAFGGALGALTEWFGWPGPWREPLATMLDARPLVPYAVWPWMLRILDVDRAIEARGYPAEIRGSIEIECIDSVLAANGGARRISWAGGRASVESASRAALRLDVRGLAALYTGWQTAGELAEIGLLGGGTPVEYRLLDAVFGGPDPWMVEVV